ncbi:Protein FAN [Frankliniella fusca]|uniref:Protein FAN n=1 Tax=Frankliniella fusca TaxID=407009 RepID=A0AAE1HQ72_9NEOP|nr:Protein FAN [Frankliniella fusca]
MDKHRFSLLLLEPGEIYFEDFSVVLLPSNSINRQDGRLKLCSKSIVFDPKELSRPIIKIPIKDCTSIEKLPNKLNEKEEGKGGISIETNLYVTMLEGNIVAPYTFHHTKERFQFVLNYANVQSCIAQISQLHRASTLPLAEQNTMLAAITFSRQSRMGFDALWLEDLYETHVIETQGSKISPLVVNPGHILLTDSALYYQPFNNIETQPVLKVRLADMRSVVRRRFLLQPVGLEVHCRDGSVPHLFLALKSAKERDELYEGIMSQSSVKLDDLQQEAVTLQWQHGVLSNYDYLLYLNSLADRTFNDLTQYPVFPWVVSDYTSPTLQIDAFKTYRNLQKPVGALNSERLEKLKERFNEMPEPKFMYGSHYSTPGFVLFYLVRKFPHYMLCLQNGRFDHPDRMFNSVADVWRNVLGNSSDFKELVPEFYDVSGGGDFLSNRYGINFGYRHDGTKVNDVTLPPWASSPADFVNKLRDALESSYVSQNLHSWIDLIFGYKQTGEAAVKANNVFYHLCYEGSIDLGSVTDSAQRHALEVQIMEFGQIPKQIFRHPHPKRISHSPTQHLLLDRAVSEASEDSDNSIILEKSTTFQAHRDFVRSLKLINEGLGVASVGNDGILKLHSLVESRLVHSVCLSPTPLSSVVSLPGDHRFIVGSFDNSMVVYDVQFGRVLDKVICHEDAISCLGYCGDNIENSVIVTGSWDCTVRVWRKLSVDQREWKQIRPASSLAAEFDHDSQVVCLCVSGNGKLLATGCDDGTLFVWNLEKHILHLNLPGHSGAVAAMEISKDACQLVTCGAADKMMKVFDLASGMLVCNKEMKQGLRCLALVDHYLILGGSSGVLELWDFRKVHLLQEIKAHSGPVSAIAALVDCSVVASGGEDGSVVVWRPSEK